MENIYTKARFCLDKYVVLKLDVVCVMRYLRDMWISMRCSLEWIEYVGYYANSLRLNTARHIEDLIDDFLLYCSIECGTLGVNFMIFIEQFCYVPDHGQSVLSKMFAIIFSSCFSRSFLELNMMSILCNLYHYLSWS